MSELNTTEGDFSLTKLMHVYWLSGGCLGTVTSRELGGHFSSWGRKGQFKGKPVEPDGGLV